MGGIEAHRSSVECGQSIGIVELDGFERLLDLCSEIAWCGAPYDAGENGLRALFDEDSALPDFESVEPLPLGRIKGVLDECLNGCEHAGHELLVVNHGVARCDMMEEESGVTMNQEELLDPEAQRMKQDDFGEWPTRAPGFDSPRQSFWRQALIDGLIERLHHALQCPHDGLPDGRPHNGSDSIGDDMGIAADRAGQCRLYMRGKGCRQSIVFFPAQRDRLDEHLTDGGCIGLGMVNAIAQFGELSLFRGEKEGA